MSTSRSSTSSSSWVRTVACVLLIVGGAELGARLWLGDDDDWKFWRIVVGERIDLLEQRPIAPEVLFIGDSTAASNLVPAEFTAITGRTSYNLGTRGNVLGSFEPTMLDGVLPRLRNQPQVFLVSFSSRNYQENPFFDTVAEQVNASLWARSARGEFIWGDLFALARLRHGLRAQLPHQAVDPALDANDGWQPWEYTEARNRPNARTQVPPPPWARPGTKVRPPRAKEVDEKIRIVVRLGELAGDRPVVLLLPPIGRAARPQLLRELRARAPSNVRVWDYTGADFERGEGAHLTERGARAFTRTVAERFAGEI